MTERKDEHLERIDAALEGLARHDAPDRVVQDTLKSVRDAQTASRLPNRFRDQRWASGIAASIAAVAALAIVFPNLSPERLISDADVAQTPSLLDAPGKDLSEVDEERADSRRSSSDSSERGAGAGVARESAISDTSISITAFNGEIVESLDEFRDAEDFVLGVERDALTVGDARRLEKGQTDQAVDLDRNVSVAAVGGRLETPAANEPPPAAGPDHGRVAAKQKAAKLDSADRYAERARRQTLSELRARGFVGSKDGLATSAVTRGTSEIDAAKPNKNRANEAADNFNKAAQEQLVTIEEIVVTGAYVERTPSDNSVSITALGEVAVDEVFKYQGEPINGATPTAELEPADQQRDDDGRYALGNLNARLAQQGGFAERFLARYENLDGLNYQPPTGYWANSYLPGDPAMRRLEAQLRSQYPEALATTLERNTQPFDAPANSALGVYLHATQAYVDGPSRVQVQVGLQAAERQGGLRLPMNIAVVLDLAGTVDVSVARQVRALLMALNEQRQIGDRFSVTVAGVPGADVVQPDDYRHGTVTSFIERLVDGQLAGETLDLVDAFISAVDRLAADDDPNAVLGSSLVILVTADGIDPQTQNGLERLAHQSAIAGMSVSVVTLAGVNGSDLDAIALAGQGRLLALGTPADAAPLIDRELHSASRTVARAIRLRIQLTPGVRLVDVIGSVRLNELDAERVREAERSIDARLSRNWGIEADRGEDEDGIQIVIPGMAAGENHVVLLDVVVDGPGPVVDVRVRYKDLAQMSNGVARASLSLADADTARHVQGPLERNVLKNLVAFETAEAARRAGRYLANGEAAAARAELTNALALIAGLRETVAGWESDAELLADEQRLTRFVSELDAGQYDMLVAALEYAAYRKLLPATLNED